MTTNRTMPTVGSADEAALIRQMSRLDSESLGRYMNGRSVFPDLYDWIRNHPLVKQPLRCLVGLAKVWIYLAIGATVAVGGAYAGEAIINAESSSAKTVKLTAWAVKDSVASSLPDVELFGTSSGGSAGGAVPEPSTGVLLVLGSAVLLRRRTRMNENGI